MAKAKGRAAKPNIGFVLDNSIVMAWSFEDEATTTRTPCSTGSRR